VLEDFPHAVVVSTMQELLSQRLDLVVVASANIVHAEQAIAALEAGIPTVVDKPMGRDFNETKRIIDVATQSGVPVSTFFNRRWIATL
jgi:predicted dehydrogenase